MNSMHIVDRSGICLGGNYANWMISGPCPEYKSNEVPQQAAIPPTWGVLIVEPPRDDRLHVQNLHDNHLPNVVQKWGNASLQLPNVVSLTSKLKTQIQAYLGVGVHPRTSKQLGYLYAISCGAKIIYDAHCLGTLLKDSDILLQENSLPQALGDNVSHILNPYGLFGHPDIQPWHPITKAKMGNSFEFRKIQGTLVNGVSDYRPLVQFSLPSALSNGSSIFEDSPAFFTKPKGASVMPSYFAMLPERTHVIFDQSAFWGMAFLQFPNNIRGSLILQRLLWALRGQIIISHPHAHLLPQKYEAERDADVNSFNQEAELISILHEWVETRGTIDKQMRGLMQVLVAKHFIGLEDVHTIENWLDDLNTIGYKILRAPPVHVPTRISKPTKVLTAVCFSGQVDRASHGIPETLKSLQNLLVGSIDIEEVRNLSEEVQNSMDSSGAVTFHMDTFAYLSTHDSCPTDIKWMSESELTYGVMYKDPQLPVFPFDLGEEVNSRFGRNPKTPMLYQMHGQQRCFEMVQEYAKQHNKEYLLIVRARADHRVLSMSNNSDSFAFWTEESRRHVTIPQPSGDWPSMYFPDIGGYQDRIGWGPPQYMKPYMTRWSQFFNRTHYESGAPYHGESSLRYALDSRGIPVRRIEDGDFVYSEVDPNCSLTYTHDQHNSITVT